MKNIKNQVLTLAVAGLAWLGLATGALAAWPEKPVSIVVSFAPGGATDLAGRMLAEELTKVFKQPFVVVNKPGAGGQIGTEYVATQPADGYTLLISATGHVMAPSTQTVHYEPVKSFEPIALVMRMPNLLVAYPGLPFKTFDEFLKWGKTQPGIPFGSAGTGGSTHLSGELLRHVSGLPMTHVPYKGLSLAMNDVMAGQAPTAFVDTVSVGNLVHSGKVRAIAVTSATRSKQYPDIPTITEAGFKGYDLDNWVGLYAPAGTPTDVVERLNKEVVRFLNTPEVLARMSKLGADSGNGMDARQFRQFVGNEVEKWRETIKITGVKIAE